MPNPYLEAALRSQDERRPTKKSSKSAEGSEKAAKSAASKTTADKES